MARWWTISFVALISAGIATTSIAAQVRPQGYEEAERAFQSAYNVEQRLTFQVLMTAAGYWNAVPNETFSQRLFESIQRFQVENGFSPDGVFNEPQINGLLTVAGPMFDLWGFKKVSHPFRGHSIWIPFR